MSLEVRDGEFLVLVGPSGCGKSTALRMVAGSRGHHRRPARASASEVVNDLPPKDRDVAMVFQSYALYPHMTVRENMAFALKLRRMSDRREIDRKVTEAGADRSTSSPCSTASRRALSGGQRQRVAMGRAIVREPEGVPHGRAASNLDAKLRVQTRAEIKRSTSGWAPPRST